MIALSIIIPTKKRAESLRITLESLARSASASPVPAIEVIVVDNGDDPETHNVVERASTLGLQCRYLVERQPGKSHCLNRALDAGRLGDIVAVLDDDMTVDRDWIRGVFAITSRWPGKGFYSGRSHIVWPPGLSVPAWAMDTRIWAWAFSVMGPERGDVLVPSGRWVSGNHFWMRREAIGDRRFTFPSDIDLRTHIEMSEPRMMLDLTEAGLGGVMGSDAMVEHRIQPELLLFDRLLERARRVGRGFAEVRLRPYRQCCKQARLMRRHPVSGLVFVMIAGQCHRWSRWWMKSRQNPSGTLRATERQAFYSEIHRLCTRCQTAV